MNINTLTATAIGVLVLVVILIVSPMIGESIDNAVSIPDEASATGTITFDGGNVTIAEYTSTEGVLIGSELYNFTNVTGAFNVDVSGGYNNSTNANARFVAEITANSTLVTAVDNGDNTTTITAIISGTVPNAYASTTNISVASWGSTTLSGGVDGSQWSPSVNSDIPTGYGTWSTLMSLVTVAALGIIVGLLISALRKIRQKD